MTYPLSEVRINKKLTRRIYSLFLLNKKEISAGLVHLPNYDYSTSWRPKSDLPEPGNSSDINFHYKLVGGFHVQNVNHYN
jgi:hypothetical protein